MELPTKQKPTEIDCPMRTCKNSALTWQAGNGDMWYRCPDEHRGFYDVSTYHALDKAGLVYERESPTS